MELFLFHTNYSHCSNAFHANHSFFSDAFCFFMIGFSNEYEENQAQF